MDVIGQRALNRALLARQYLLERVELPLLEAIDRLVGLQAAAERDDVAEEAQRIVESAVDAVQPSVQFVR